MEPLKKVLAARELLERVTPLKTDCGRYCGGACCQPDEDGQGGMLLFSGEEALYSPVPEGFSLRRDDSVMTGAWLLTCEGTCDRASRPLSCRLFPLLPTRTGTKLDRRAWAVCPLMESGKAGLNPDFIRAVQQAGTLLYEDEACARFLDALHDYNERLKQL